jgi:hypothetical protein
VGSLKALSGSSSAAQTWLAGRGEENSADTNLITSFFSPCHHLLLHTDLFEVTSSSERRKKWKLASYFLLCSLNFNIMVEVLQGFVPLTKPGNRQGKTISSSFHFLLLHVWGPEGRRNTT